VPRGFVQVVYQPEIKLPKIPKNTSGRLQLAEWMTRDDHPLTSRVAANRVWHHLFGRGIVKSVDNFGKMGDAPTHPQLLDWLADDFIRSGWSLKHLHRLIVSSAAYRQSSAVPPQLLERDPYNELLARGPRFRVEAEMIRDIALASSGLLSRTIGGPSVFPFQPDGVWDLPYNDEKWTESRGQDRYRRGLYTFWRRTAPYPAFLNFDAVSREACTVRRVRTNTPLQALTILNDPAFFEAAKALARRIVSEAAPDTRSRATYAFRLCLSRSPKPAELDRLLTAADKERAWFESHPDEAARLNGPELAAWTMLSNTLLSLDETITKE